MMVWRLPEPSSKISSSIAGFAFFGLTAPVRFAFKTSVHADLQQHAAGVADLLSDVIFIDLISFYEYISVSIKLNGIYLNLKVY